MSSGDKRGRGRRCPRNKPRNPPPTDKAPSNIDEDSEVYQQFLVYQKCLDTRHDKHERLVKLSRDVTIDSKRVIFLLQRISSDSDKTKILPEAVAKLEEIQNVRWRPIAKELEGEDPYQFLRAYSPGLQEYIEAVSFHRFLDNGELISMEEVAEALVFPREDPKPEATSDDPTEDKGLDDKSGTPESKMDVDAIDHSKELQPNQSQPSAESHDLISVYIPPMEYMLGIADLTGEVMRKAIHSVGTGNLELPNLYCKFLRTIHDNFLPFGHANRELSRKMFTLKQSLQKVEMACYTLKVRGSEIPKHMLVDVLQTMDTDNYGEDPV